MARAGVSRSETDGRLADAILRKIAADYGTAILVERHEAGGIGGLIDTSWFDLTAEEAEYLDRIRAEEER